MRGSASIELLILAMVAIYAMATVYKAVVAGMIDRTTDLHKIAAASIAANKISAAISVAAKSPPGDPVDVQIYVPRNVTLSCEAGSSDIRFNVQTAKKYSSCGNTNSCDGHATIPLICDNLWRITGDGKAHWVRVVKIGADEAKIGEIP